MSIKLEEIKDTQLIQDAPAILQKNFSAIKTYLDKLEESFNPENRNISLINGATVANGGIAVNNIQVILGTGTGISVSDGTGIKFSVTASGKTITTGISVSSESDFVSELQKTVLNKESSFKDKFISEGTLDLSGVNSKVLHRQVIIAVVPQNIGFSATERISLADKGKRVFLDCHNNGYVLGSNDGVANIHLGVTDLLIGQELEIMMLRRNVVDTISLINRKPTGMSDGIGNPIYEPLFAQFTANGFEDVPMESLLTCDAVTLGAKVNAIWTNIGTISDQVLRLVILDLKGFSII